MEEQGDREMAETFDGPDRFVHSLEQENDRLRRLLHGQRMRIAEAEGAPGNPVSELRDRVDLLSEENHLLRCEVGELQRQVQQIERDRRAVGEEYLSIQDQNERLLHLYLAAQRLHGSMDADEILRAIVELVVNFIGSECFDLCAYDLGRDELVVLVSVGTAAQRGARLEIPRLARAALREGCALTDSGGTQATDELRACVPLKVDDRILGAILIRELLAHKATFRPIDHELFEVIGAHAGTALCLSHVARQAGLTAGQRRWSPMLLDMIHRPPESAPEIYR
jgi:hypothetical protein